MLNYIMGMSSYRKTAAKPLICEYSPTYYLTYVFYRTPLVSEEPVTSYGEPVNTRRRNEQWWRRQKSEKEKEKLYG